MTTLLVIEAPGKVQALSKILDGLDFEARVFATKGHIYANPEDIKILGLDKDYNEIMRQPINPEILEELVIAAEDADFVIIGTDPDQEGDAIAKDVADLLVGQRVLRAKFHGLDEKSVMQGLKEIGQYHEEHAWPGIGRRIVDRMIGYFMTTEVNIPSGRVQSSILGSVGTNPAPHSELTLSLPAGDGGSPFTATLPVNWFNEEDMEEMWDASKDLPAVAVDDKKTIRGVFNEPWNLGDIMVETQKKVLCSVNDIQSSIQSMYEGGLMSYPRASVRGVGEGALDCLDRIAERNGVKHLFNRDKLPRLDKHGAHEAPHPLVDHIEIGMPMKLMDHHTAIMAMVTRNLLMSGIEQVKEFPDVRSLPEWAKKIPWSRTIAPASIPWNTIKPEAGFKKIDPQVAIISRMMDIGVGRPGTYVSHAEKFISRGLVGPDLKMTSRGRDWMDRIPPVLVDYESSDKIESFLENSGYRPESMAAMVMDQLGANISGPIIKKMSE